MEEIGLEMVASSLLRYNKKSTNNKDSGSIDLKALLGGSLGQGVGCGLAGLARNPDLLKLRVQHNSFPIFEEGGDHSLRFRYMRQWVESGHEKGGIQLSPLLAIAMDALDSALDNEKVASIKLGRGDIAYCNNMNFAHARDAFQNGKGKKPRHHVRVWFNL